MSQRKVHDLQELITRVIANHIEGTGQIQLSDELKNVLAAVIQSSVMPEIRRRIAKFACRGCKPNSYKADSVYQAIHQLLLDLRGTEDICLFLMEDVFAAKLRAQFLLIVSDFYFENNIYPTAITFLERAYNVLQQLPVKSDQTLDLMFDIKKHAALIHRHAGEEYIRGICLLDCVNILTSKKSKSDADYLEQGSLYKEVAAIFANGGNYEDARSNCLLAFEVLARTQFSPESAVTARNMIYEIKKLEARILFVSGNFLMCTELVAGILQGFSADPNKSKHDQIEIAFLYRLSGVAFYHLGNYAAAQICLKETIKYHRPLPPLDKKISLVEMRIATKYLDLIDQKIYKLKRQQQKQEQASPFIGAAMAHVFFAPEEKVFQSSAIKPDCTEETESMDLDCI